MLNIRELNSSLNNQMKLLYPLEFIPQPKKRIWGGNKLRKIYNKPFNGDQIGESWEVSTIPNSISKVAYGTLKGLSLDKLILEYKYRLVGKSVYEKYNNKFPILIKFIDAKEDLSVQLHPNDDIAKTRHSSFGKTEMWYIMDSNPESKLILGFKEEVTKKIYLNHLKNNTLNEILNYESISPGDALLINPGKVHAIGGGILLAEIQQSSDITYRIYDYQRKDQNGQYRELHTDLAEDIIDFKNRNNFRLKYNFKENNIDYLVNSKHFKTKIHNINKRLILSFQKVDSFVVLICVKGNFNFFQSNYNGSVNLGSCLMIPAELDNIILEGENVIVLQVHM